MEIVDYLKILRVILYHTKSMKFASLLTISALFQTTLNEYFLWQKNGAC